MLVDDIEVGKEGQFTLLRLTIGRGHCLIASSFGLVPSWENKFGIVAHCTASLKVMSDMLGCARAIFVAGSVWDGLRTGPPIT